jgi:hypothetical protein
MKLDIPNGEEDIQSTTLRCGLDTLYIALGFLEEKSGAEFYAELAKFFPDIEREGTTISRVEECFIARGFVCRSLEL